MMNQSKKLLSMLICSAYASGFGCLVSVNAFAAESEVVAPMAIEDFKAQKKALHAQKKDLHTQIKAAKKAGNKDEVKSLKEKLKQIKKQIKATRKTAKKAKKAN